jgi:hypothetical protein
MPPLRQDDAQPAGAMHILLFLPMDNTSGIDLAGWVERSMPDVHRFADPDSKCFLCSPVHAHLFPDVCTAYSWASCSWRRDHPLPFNASVFVQFRTASKLGLFWRRVAPRVEALRAVHEPNGGSVNTMALLREPRAHLASIDPTWPPRLPVDGPASSHEGRDNSTLHPSDGHRCGLHTFIRSWSQPVQGHCRRGPRREAPRLSPLLTSEGRTVHALRGLCTFDQVANLSTLNVTWMAEAMRAHSIVPTFMASHTPSNNRVMRTDRAGVTLYRGIENATPQVRVQNGLPRHVQPCTGGPGSHSQPLTPTACMHSTVPFCSAPLSPPSASVAFSMPRLPSFF